MPTNAIRCPECRSRLEEWEFDYVIQFGRCSDCVSDARPRCRQCGGTYLMVTGRGTCGLCEGAHENAKLGVY